MPDRFIESLDELLTEIQVTRFDVYQTWGTAEAGFADIGNEPERPDGDTLTLVVAPNVEVHPTHIMVRCRVIARNTTGMAGVDMAGFFAFNEPAEVSTELGSTFTEKFGLGALWPYLRQRISDTSSQLAGMVPVLLPIVAPDGFKLTARPTTIEFPSPD